MSNHQKQLESDLHKIQSLPKKWWSNFHAIRPEQVTFDNVLSFLDYNKDDNLLKDAEVAPECNATLLIEWDTESFMCSLNIGEKDFSYSILPVKGGKPYLGQASINDKDEIKKFFNRLKEIVEDKESFPRFIF